MQNPPSLGFDEHGTMAKSALQETQPTYFGRVAKNHDGATAAEFRTAASIKSSKSLQLMRIFKATKKIRTNNKLCFAGFQEAE
jgi:hypothetical protein